MGQDLLFFQYLGLNLEIKIDFTDLITDLTRKKFNRRACIREVGFPTRTLRDEIFLSQKNQKINPNYGKMIHIRISLKNFLVTFFSETISSFFH